MPLPLVFRFSFSLNLRSCIKKKTFNLMPLTCCRNGPSTAPTKVSRPSAGLTEQENKKSQHDQQIIQQYTVLGKLQILMFFYNIIKVSISHLLVIVIVKTIWIYIHIYFFCINDYQQSCCCIWAELQLSNVA